MTEQRSFEELTTIYRETSATLSDLREAALDCMPPEMSLADAAAAFGWREASLVQTLRRREAGPSEPPSREKILPEVPYEWADAKPLVKHLAGLTGCKETTIRRILKDFIDVGAVESQGKRQRYMGRMVTIHTHYRRTGSPEGLTL